MILMKYKMLIRIFGKLRSRIFSLLQTANCQLPSVSGRQLMLVPLLMLLLFAPGCEEDFDITAPYQDITVVFGLVDPGEDSIFVKINKAFLGDGDILEMARIEDSSNYVTALQAVIEEWENGSMARSYTLDTITIKNKEEGVFYNPYQVVYYAPYEPATTREYRLKINVNNREITASTPLVRNFNIEKPSAGTRFIQFKPETTGEVAWVSAKNGRRYEVVIRFNYKELFIGNPDTVYRSIDWAMGTRKSVNTNGGEEMSISYSNDGFYTLLANKVPYSDPAMEASVAERFTNNVDVFVAVAAEELNTYMEVNEPSSSIVQDKPEYTNISGGTGIFSSRFRNTRNKKVHPETVEFIQTREETRDLKFVF